MAAVRVGGMVNPGAGDWMTHAVDTIDLAIYKDSASQDLSDRLGYKLGGDTTCSGHQQSYVPCIDSYQVSSPGASYHEIGMMRRMPLPAELKERFGGQRRNSLMGVFPDIRRAWLCIDSELYVWNYENGSDVAYYDGLSETIQCVQLVKPRPGVFQPHITHLLCVATTNNIILLGVCYVPASSGDHRGDQEELTLLPEALFSEPTDVFMTCITATKSGRIFLGGRNGCLYEFCYQAEGGWFRRKCWKTNHSQTFISSFMPSFLSGASDDAIAQIVLDESRKVLYTRTESGSIEVYDLGGDGSKMGSSKKLTSSEFHSGSSNIGNLQSAGKLISIAPITSSESTNLHLIGITDIGSRVYFSTVNVRNELSANEQKGQYANKSTRVPKSAPITTPCIRHVRVSPTYDARLTRDQMIQVNSALYSNGTMMLSYTLPQSNSDRLLFVSSDNFPFTDTLTESFQSHDLGGNVWSMCEIPSERLNLPEFPFVLLGSTFSDPPAVISQHHQAEEKFVLIDALGTCVVTKLSPLEKLYELLTKASVDSDVVKKYFSHHKEQACATCLVLICSKIHTHHLIQSNAIRAFFLYGSSADYSTLHSQPIGHSTPQGNAGMDPLTPGMPTPRVHLDYVSSPSNSMYSPAAPHQDPYAVHSNSYRYLAIYLYVGRILRPIWHSKMVELIEHKKKSGVNFFCAARPLQLSSVLDVQQVNWIHAKLQNLQEFMNEHLGPYLSRPDSGLGLMQNQTPQHAGMRRDQLIMDAQMRHRNNKAQVEAEEHQSLRQLLQLITSAGEYLRLWKVLCEHQFHIIAANLSKVDQDALYNMTFKDLMLHGRGICKQLINHLIDMYVNDNAATDAISAHLRELCPSLYAYTDVIFSKACERLQAARNSQRSSERNEMMQEALKSYKEVSAHIDLAFVCNQFASVQFYTGIVELCHVASKARDPQGLAQHYYDNNKPSYDLQGANAFAVRQECYQPIIVHLDSLISTSQQNPSTSLTVPTRPGPPTLADPIALPLSDAERYADEMFATALKYKDEIFQVTLYDWLIVRNMSEKLLEIDSSYLEKYLKMNTSHPSGGSSLMWNLLWKMYEKQRNFPAAARILASLAERQSDEMQLNQRIEYLSRACMCAKSSTSGFKTAGDGDFLHELEEKMDVARLQLQIYEELDRMNLLKSEDIRYLNSALYDITTISDSRIERVNYFCLLVVQYKILVLFCWFDDELIFATASHEDVPDITSDELYNEFAEKHTLSKIKLAILHSAGHYDLALVEAVWNEIIEKELDLSENGSPIVKIKVLQSMLLSQAKLYQSSENYFPIAFLVKRLERLSCEMSLYDVDSAFVYQTMLDAGVSCRKLFDVYDKLYKQKDPVWSNWRQPYHLVHCIAQILTNFTNQPSQVSNSERSQFVIAGLDSLSHYLNDLQSESRLDEHNAMLVKYLQNLQATLKTMRLNRV